MHSALLTTVFLGAAMIRQIDYDAGTEPGRITYYEQSGNGACDIPQNEWPEYTAALDENHFLGGMACGATVRITNRDKAIVVMIVDLCPVAGNEQWCSGDLTHFDLGGEAAFGQLEPPLSGVKEVEFQWLPAPVGDTPVKLRFKDGINPWWVAIEVLNHRYPIARLEIKNPQTGSWLTGDRTQPGMWNYFQFDFTGNGLQAPFDIRITDQYGQIILESAPVVQEKYQWTGKNQFPLLPRHRSAVLYPGERAFPPDARLRVVNQRLQVNLPEGTLVQVYDLRGMVVASLAAPSAAAELRLPRLSSGVYAIRAGRGSLPGGLQWFCIR
jgi:expansin (peptidoglycan-binding protein)